MNIFKETASKYPAYYNQEGNKVVSGPEGKIYFDAKETVIDVSGSHITVYSVDSIGIVPTVEPIRIVLFLKNESELDLTIFPKSRIKKFFEFFIPKKIFKIPIKIRNQFSFGGNEKLINELMSDRLFIENILNEEVYIVINKKTSQNILLTPAYGISSLEEFDKFVAILKSIESKIRTSKQVG